MDSDLTNPPEFIKSFLTFVDQDYDIIKADRFLRESDMSEVPLKRRLFQF